MMWRVLGLCVGMGLSSALQAASPSATQEIPEAYVEAATRNSIPPAILYSVASAESVMQMDDRRRPWPWTLNVAGRGMRFDDRRSACAALNQALKTTSIVDVGIAQLNVRWQPQVFGPGKRFARPCDGLDPYANLDEAAKIIRAHYNASGDWLVAAGRYHHPAGGPHAQRYRSIVSRELLAIRKESRSLLVPNSKAIARASDGSTITWITPSPHPATTNQNITWVTPKQRDADAQEIATR
ncbi:hypothetical protein [Carnimonas bestiolae]|uniref:hypothetical protein n=1 Tax=Carnimonas bestiolae TaxID=3402172 RepID=UPI003EDC42B5